MADAIAMADLDLGVATSNQLGGREMIYEFLTVDMAVTTAAVVRDEPPAEGVSILLHTVEVVLRLWEFFSRRVGDHFVTYNNCSPVVCFWGESLLIVVWPSPRPYNPT